MNDFWKRGDKMMKAAIIGVTGYTGLELVRLIQRHPILQLGTLHSHSQHTANSVAFYPHLQGLVEQAITPYTPEKVMAENEIVFFATPAGVTKNEVAAFAAADFPVIDLSGDLRLKDGEVYKKWYKSVPAKKELLKKAQYCLPEFMETKPGNLIANPGCYATAALLSAIPLVKAGLITDMPLIFDGKSGFSGAGKSLSDHSHFVTADENMTLYKLNEHQHIPEIIHGLQQFDSSLKTIQFTTSLIPVKRGIMMTLYAKIKKDVTELELYEAYTSCYHNRDFVRMQPLGELPQLRQVVGTNFCDIGMGLNPQTGILTVVGVIDNLVKGASGQALQNFNLWAQLDEDTGLKDIPLYP